MATLKDLKLKTGICKRGLKELQSYETEVQRETAKTTAMKERNADPYDLKQQENVLGESKMMIPDCLKRLETALQSLQTAVAEAGENEELTGSEELTAAKLLVAEVEPMFS